MKNIHEDDTGIAIREIISNGVNIERTMDIDFFIDIQDEEDGNKIASEIKEKGFNTSLEYDKEEKAWTCYCTKNMFLDYEAIIEIESLLDNVAKKYNGKIDGFATYGN